MNRYQEILSRLLAQQAQYDDLGRQYPVQPDPIWGPRLDRTAQSLSNGDFLFNQLTPPLQVQQPFREPGNYVIPVDPPKRLPLRRT